METRPPTITRILVAIGFALSCFALALFLWITFGGPLPLKPEGYRVTVPFDEATQLAVESDVRISGVPVGKVKAVELADSGLAEATIELDSRYAPIPTDTRAMLRTKTLLGETFVELTPGDGQGETLEEGGDLPRAQVAESVQLDEIWRTFDTRTRSAFKVWMQGTAASLRGRGDDLSAAIAELGPFAEETNRLLRVLDSQRLAVRRLVHDGGTVFQALSERQGQLRGLIQNSEAVFSTTARRNQELADLFTDPAHLPARVARHPGAPQQLRPEHRPARPAAPARGARAEPHPGRGPEGGARPRGVLQGAAAHDRRLGHRLPRGPQAAQRRPDAAADPARRRRRVPTSRTSTRSSRCSGMYKHEITAFLGNAAAATQLQPASAGAR